MNKTPIQELKEQLEEEDIRCLSIDYYLEKEKQFAFDCFEAGFHYEGKKENFEYFYSQYAEQHKK